MLVILEEIRSQNRATLEAVEAHRQVFKRILDEFRSDVRADMGMLKSGVLGLRQDLQQLKAEVGALKEQVARMDAVITADYRERLNRLAERVEALERRA